jgi:2-keto-4-pentenoate hydratase/2-oxohepta-3-ene-1,7-dioic acid hydratase in catechol pathway
MKLISFAHAGQVRSGLWLDKQVLDLGIAARITGQNIDLSSVPAIIAGQQSSLQAVRALEQRAAELKEALLPSTGVRRLAPIAKLSRNAFCVGRNYLDHVKEGFDRSAMPVKVPEVPQFFSKATHTLNSPDGDVRLDARVTSVLDYEVELAVIIGTGGRDIPAERAMEHIFGYTVANDFTARDLQRRHEQWFKGKSLDSLLPLGPWIIDKETIGDPTTLELSLTVNGQQRQRARVAQMIFNIPTIIASLSAGLTLEAGDVICTGTPAGVGYAMNPPQPLKVGDQVVSSIDRIGTLNNKIVAA